MTTVFVACLDAAVSPEERPLHVLSSIVVSHFTPQTLAAPSAPMSMKCKSSAVSMLSLARIRGTISSHAMALGSRSGDSVSEG